MIPITKMHHSKLLPRYRPFYLSIIRRDRHRVPVRTSNRFKQVMAFDKLKTPFITIGMHSYLNDSYPVGLIFIPWHQTAGVGQEVKIWDTFI